MANAVPSLSPLLRRALRAFAPLVLLLAGAASAQSSDPNGGGNATNPECISGFCGAPQQNGGGCGCGCGGSVLYNYTDDGKTYSYSDDADGDGVPDNFDNCPYVPNRDQADKDGDGVGDACDNCPLVSNKDQKDTNGNGIGDACDPDIDGDGIPNELDNCPTIPNPDQKITCKTAADCGGFISTKGDVCNDDIDGDGVKNAVDNCPLVPNPNQLPSDPSTFQAQGKQCTLDTDGDGIPDTVDNCPLVANPDQKMTCKADWNPNGKDCGGKTTHLGDACNVDPDLDGVNTWDKYITDPAHPGVQIKAPDAKQLDNCPSDYNPDQKDSDRNGKGDACDPGFCLVVDKSNPSACLDPNLTFAVGAGVDGAIGTGQNVQLPLFANRKNVGIRYTWAVVDRPAGSSAGVSNAKGAVSFSSGGFQYYYVGGREPTWTPDVAGTYRIRLSAELVFDDPVFPGHRQATSDLVVNASGNSMGGSCANAGLTPLAIPALGLALLWMRRRRQQQA
jgi:hypothetical protein